MGRVVTNPTGSVVDASEVKILYESNENTNAYTDGDKASLDEVKDAIDMAKKVVEITFLLNDWTSNSDGTYSQTVNNSEIKSSMNPDLISMLSSDATPEEQKAYMKNFSILCQGVGNTTDGSVTYKIYKQMTGDITVGLTRLGGVRQIIENETKVDDVKVGGVSVVKDKIAEIPAIPSANDFVPYSGATKDVNIGNHSISLSTTGKMGELTASGTFGIGKNSFGARDTAPGIDISTEAHTEDYSLRDSFSLTLFPTGLSVDAKHEGDDGVNRTSFEVGADGFSVRRGPDTEVKITADKVTGLALPTDNKDAANKKYVDDAVANVGSGTMKIVRYRGPFDDVPANSTIEDDFYIDVEDGYSEIGIKSISASGRIPNEVMSTDRVALPCILEGMEDGESGKTLINGTLIVSNPFNKTVSDVEVDLAVLTAKL